MVEVGVDVDWIDQVDVGLTDKAGRTAKTVVRKWMNTSLYHFRNEERKYIHYVS